MSEVIRSPFQTVTPHQIIGKTHVEIVKSGSLGYFSLDDFRISRNLISDECIIKDFLLFLKCKNIKIGLATSGLDYKARGEIESAFSLLGLGKPTDFYDSIVTGGREKKKGRYGTRGELVSKPHPWIYSELALGLSIEDPSNAVVMEDSSAGVISARLAGFNVIGFKDGNIYPSGLNDQRVLMADGFDEIKEFTQ